MLAALNDSTQHRGVGKGTEHTVMLFAPSPALLHPISSLGALPPLVCRRSLSLFPVATVLSEISQTHKVEYHTTSPL